MMRRISASTCCSVVSDTLLCVVTERPRNTSPSFSPYTIGPIESDMPKRVTMARASSVARSKSFDAPVEMSCTKSSSAMRPPNRKLICASIWLLYWLMRSRSGNTHVNPKARPRGMMVTLCTGSRTGSVMPTTACPDSWYAVARFSSSVITIDLRSAPMKILSLARSKSSISTRRLLPRAANSAASFTRFARSAPDMPGVPRAIISALTSGAIGTLRICTSKICSRPRISGSGTTT